MDNLRSKIASKYTEATGKPYLPDDRKPVLPTHIDVRIRDFRPLEKGTMIGFSDLLIVADSFAFALNDCAVHEKNGRLWVNLPARQYKKRDGSTGYAPLVEIINEEARQLFQNAVVKELYKTEVSR